MTGAHTQNELLGDVIGAAVQAGVVHDGVHLHVGPPAHAIRVPAQLPAAVPIVDRLPQQATLTGLVESRATAETSAVAMLTGDAGIGKTALAVSWAARVRTAFPDGQLHVCLRDIPSTEVPAMWLRALGVPPEWVPVHLAEQVTLYRTLTADKALLVLVDDAPDAATVERLRPASPHSMVVVTSRVPLLDVAAAGAVVLPLNALSDQDSAAVLAMLGARTNEDPDGAARLVALCAGRPLSLCLVLAHLKAHPISLTDLADWLTPTGRDLDGVGVTADNVLERALSLPETDLPPAIARTMRRIALHRGPHVTAQIAGAAADIDPVLAQQHLEVLAKRGVLTRDGELFRCDDTSTRDHFRALSDEQDARSDQVAAWTRIATATYYAATPYDHTLNRRRPRNGRAALSPGTPPTYTRTEALAWFDREWLNLVAAQLALAEAAPAEAVVWELAEALHTYCHRQHTVTTWIEVTELGVAAAHASGHRTAEVRQRCMLTQALLVHGRAEDAASHANTAVTLALEIGDHALLASALSAFGKTAVVLRHLDTAVSCFRAAVAADLRARNWRGAALHERRLGKLLTGLDRFPEAVTILARAEVRMVKHGGRTDVARVRTFLGEALTHVGDVNRAKVVLAQALTGARTSGTPRYVADVDLALALLALRTGDSSSARRLAQQALHVFLIDGDRRDTRRARAVLTQIDDAGDPPDPESALDATT